MLVKYPKHLTDLCNMLIYINLSQILLNSQHCTIRRGDKGDMEASPPFKSVKKKDLYVGGNLELLKCHIIIINYTITIIYLTYLKCNNKNKIHNSWDFRY